MKKLIGILLAVALLLCACAQGSGENFVTKSKKDAFTTSGQKVESSIFGRSVKYDSFTPAGNIALPIEPAETLDMVQIEKCLYFLGDGAVYSLDIETGETKKLFDTDATMFATHGGMLYTYSAETAKLSEYDTAGAVTKEITIEIADIHSYDGFSVTDDYYVINCYTDGKMYEPTLLIYSRETEELTLSKKTLVMRMYPYKGNKLLTATQDDVFGAIHLNAFDAESGKSERLQTLGSSGEVGYRPAVVYCPKTDTVLVFGSGMNPDGSSRPVCITEYSLDDTDKIVHNRYYFDFTYEAKFFLGVYENIVSAVSTADSEYRIFDYLNPPESITFLTRIGVLEDVAYQFEKDTGILIREAYTDDEKLALKLMAGDDDFDIFNPTDSYHIYVDAGACVDLKGIESLNSRISGNDAADLVVSYDGKYFGVPARIDNYETEDSYPEDGSTRSYSLMISEHIYYARNVDVAEGRYSDPNGEELYKLLKFINDNPAGNRKKMPFGEDVIILYAHMYMLNPKSQNRDSAIRFLEYLFDCYNGDISGVIPEEDHYPKLESTENCYASWRCEVASINTPVFEARNAVHNQNGSLSNSELKKLAKETAAKVRMRIME